MSPISLGILRHHSPPLLRLKTKYSLLLLLCLQTLLDLLLHNRHSNNMFRPNNIFPNPYRGRYLRCKRLRPRTWGSNLTSRANRASMGNRECLT